MNTESSLKLKVKTVRRMDTEFETTGLLKSEAQNLTELTDEMRDLSEEYIRDMGAEELLRRLGPEHWLVISGDIEITTGMLLDGLEELLEAG